MLIPFATLVKNHGLQIRGIVHVGAHHGWEFKHYRAENIQDLAFIEPLPSNFEQLRGNVTEDCLLFNTALGNFVGEIDMNVETVNMGQSSSCLEPGTHLTQYPHIKFDQVVRVPITKLDLLPLEHARYNMLNIDVQGYELEVLKGGEETLKAIDCLYLEVNRAQVYKGCVEIDELDAWLLAHGFKREHTAWIGGDWGDAVYLRVDKAG